MPAPPGMLLAMALWHPNDPDRTLLHRGLRVAVALPALLALGLVVLHDRDFALLAAFGAFAALAMADFTGPRRSRLVAHLVLAVVGAVLVVLGTLLSNTLWPAVAIMLVVGIVVQFAMVLGGQFALGDNAVILAFVVAVTVPADPAAIAFRVAGWLAAMVVSALLATFLWPRHERRDLYQRLAEACRSLAAAVRAVAEDVDAATSIEASRQAIERVRAEHHALGFRAIGPRIHQQALLGVVDLLGQGYRFAHTIAAARSVTAGDRALAHAVARALDDVAGVADDCAEGRRGDPPDVGALVRARHAHRAGLDASIGAALGEGAPGAAVVGRYSEAFPIRVLSYVTLAMAVDACVMAGCRVRVEDDFALSEPTEATGFVRSALDLIAPHLSPHSVWFRNCARAGAALALAVLVAKASDISHAFWVVLATLTVLRSNAVTTGATVLNAIAGTLAGFAIAWILMALLGTSPAGLWLTLPLLVFLAAYAPAALSFGTGQATFALMVVVLFNIMVPQGWVVAAVRLEAVAAGAAVAFVTSLIMWPQGASAALRTEVAVDVRAARRLVVVAFDALLGHASPGQVDAARGAALASRHRADEALAAYVGERGTKRLPLDVWALLARAPILLRQTADAAIAMRRSGFTDERGSHALDLLLESLSAVEASYAELADRLDNPQRAADPALAAVVDDLNMIGGAGTRREAILAAAAAHVEAHRGDAATRREVMILAWGVGWLGYLAHLRVAVRAPLEAVVSRAGTPWWR